MDCFEVGLSELSATLFPARCTNKQYKQVHNVYLRNSPYNLSGSSSGGSSSSRNGYYLGGIIALLLQDHRTM